MLPTDEQLRAWARLQLSDSRFMQLPADLLRVLVHEVSIAAVEEFKNSPVEKLKTSIARATKHLVSVQPCYGCGNNIAHMSAPPTYTTRGDPPMTVCIAQGCNHKTCSECPKNKCVKCSYSVCKDHTDWIQKCKWCDDVICGSCLRRHTHPI